MIEELNRVIARMNKKPDKEELEVLLKCQQMLADKVPIRNGTWTGKEIEVLNKHLFMSSKPIVYLVNIGRDEYIAQRNKFLPKI